MTRRTFLLCYCLSIFPVTFAQDVSSSHTYLALGDSYTIGESVPANDNFPHQALRLLRDAGLPFSPPEIIAKTGWTTDELQHAIDSAHLHPPYDVVSLLIGVNNQYRGRDSGEYAREFERLLQQAISFSGRGAAHVFVLSIPDWSATPFAKGRDVASISQQIDRFNEINRRISKQYQVNYIDITPGTRLCANDETLLAGDGLHPSAKEYARWATLLSQAMRAQLK